jgi:hypothetical protein
MNKFFASLGITVIVCAAGSLLMTQCGVHNLIWHMLYGVIVGTVVMRLPMWD